MLGPNAVIGWSRDLGKYPGSGLVSLDMSVNIRGNVLTPEGISKFQSGCFPSAV